MINIINQLFEIEKKAKDQNISIFERNFDRLNTEISDLGYMVENPLGKKYDARDTSIEANVAGSSPNPIIVKVLKPIIFHKEGEQIILVQKGIVIAE